ncbi:MAG TPA: LysM peptidoglycan-binding domain-containing protein [Aggregatilineaceae bacterium]|nr:LysM peptidoglycan-binding domain-containing protein [Aggregatilineaceae bacterium]
MQNWHSRFALLVALAVVAAVLTGSVVQAQTTNLLQNPGFDGPYRSFSKMGTVATGWAPWAIPKKAGDPGYVLTPQYRQAANIKRVHSAGSAQEFFEVYAVYDAGVYQQVTVPQNAALQFSAFMSAWSSALDNPDKSDQPSPIRMRVAIDPTGGTDITSSNIVWSADDPFDTDPGVYDTWVQPSVSATAQGTKVTVFVEGAIKNPNAHGSFFVDDASLTVQGGAAPSPTATVVAEVPTDTAIPPTSAPSDTPVAPSPTDTPVPPTSTLGFEPPTREGTVLPTVEGGPTGTPGFVTVTAVPFVTFTPTAEGGIPSNLPDKILYTVQAGDTLSGIAAQYNSDVNAIEVANGLTSDVIYVGQQLVVPVPAQAPTITPSPYVIYVTATSSGPITPTAPIEAAVLNGPTLNGIGTYIVQPGDTFGAIARHYNLTEAALAQLNGIVNPGQVTIGTVLVVPGPGNNSPGGTVAPTVLPTVPPSANPKTYVVQRGDDLFRISIRFNVTIVALMRANNLVNPNLVYVGQVLIIP